MGKEKVFNLFILYDDSERVLFFGHVVHEIEGSDEEKTDFLRKRVEVDLRIAKLERAPTGMTLGTVNAHARLGDVYKLFAHVFAEHPVNQPISCVTPVVNGVIKVDYQQADHEPIDIADVDRKSGNSEMQDWLIRYHIDGSLHLAQLINDDYFEAIKILFNKGMYVSATKLLVSCIDSLAYVEYGGTKDNVFVTWLNKFADLTPIGITPAELWEHRNGLLHMSNLESKKVAKKDVRCISSFVGKNPFGPHMTAGDVHYFDLHQLILIIGNAIGKWLETYSAEPSKFTAFVERYDKVISDARLGRLVWEEAGQQPKV